MITLSTDTIRRAAVASELTPTPVRNAGADPLHGLFPGQGSERATAEQIAAVHAALPNGLPVRRVALSNEPIHPNVAYLRSQLRRAAARGEFDPAGSPRAITAHRPRVSWAGSDARRVYCPDCPLDSGILSVDDARALAAEHRRDTAEPER